MFFDWKMNAQGKVLGMSHERFFWLGTYDFGNFSWLLIFKNTSNANLFDVFYR